MSTIDITKAKRHLNIDANYNDDNDYILSLIEVAGQSVEQHINQSLDLIAFNNGGEIPAPVIHAMLLLIGHLYNSREAVSFNGKAEQIPLSYQYLLSPFIQY